MPLDLFVTVDQNSDLLWLNNLKIIIGIISGIIILITAIVGLIYHEKLRAFISDVLSKIKKKNTILNYFKSNIPNNRVIDFFFYQLGLRKNLPIMDWLYFEYIKYLDKTSKIKKLIIFPVIDMTEISQLDNDLNIFRDNVNRVFYKSNIEFKIIDPYKDIYFDKKDLVSNDFIETLKYIGSKKYFDYLRKFFNIRINSISDFNKFHPYDDKIKNIYTHINKSWSIINYIKENVDLTMPVNISTIFWEWEVDKLSIMKYYSNNNDNITFCPILGITQMLKKNKPIPIFIEDETICIFDDIKNIIKKAIKLMTYLKKFNSLLESVISEYSNEINKKDIKENGERLWRISQNEKDIIEINHFKPTKEFYLFLGLIDKIRMLYRK